MWKIFLAPLFIIACATESKVELPPWTKEPTRSVDNGYIVYIGSAEGPTQEKAQFKAEGIALEDLANECSLLPLGVRIEDRFSSKEKTGYISYVKVGVEFQECTHGQKSIEPSEIKKIANVSMTEQLKRYQDLEQTGEMPSPQDASAQIEPPKDYGPIPQETSTSQTHFYVVRQYVAYQKQVVILSPPNAYAPHSIESQNFVKAVQPATEQVEHIAIKHPILQTQPQPWSKLNDKPHVDRPTALSPKHPETRRAHELNPPHNMPKSSPHVSKIDRRKRKHRH